MARVLIVLSALAFACLGVAPGVYADDWCYEPDGDSFSTVLTDSSLIVFHRGAGYNCCPDSIVEHVSVVDRTVRIEEVEYTSPMGGCACMCCYTLSTEIVGLQPGPYHIRFGRYEWDLGWVWVEFDDVIPADMAADDFRARYEKSGCGHAPQPVESETWGRIKVRFGRAE